MKIHWIALVLLLTSCAPRPHEAQTAKKPLLTPRPVATHTAVPTPFVATPTERPVPPVKEEWLVLASDMRRKAQRAIEKILWEDIAFKEEAYWTLEQMIEISEGTVKQDSKEMLKRFRWGIEMMDVGQLQEVIEILDQYN